MVEKLSNINWGRELMASVVVFLVALPLCMGIAIASGVPPALGLVTGIVGGILVGSLAGQPVQVSGPAAGLAVMVWQLVDDFGLNALGLAVIIAGALQFVAGLLKLGRWFRAVSPAVIQGMLAGIGVLIFSSQFHVMVDDAPRSSGLMNLASIPEAIYKGIFPVDGSVHHLAAAVGMVTIGSIVLWNTFRPKFLNMVPGPLVGVLLGTGTMWVLGFPIARVSVPTNLFDSLNFIESETLSLLKNPTFWGESAGMAVIASAETLLCATAVDRIHDGPKTKYNQELWAQGVGNIVCGLLGALPMTGVIVRSSANVEAGGKTRASAILHGIWILVLVVAAAGVLALIPTAGLAAILVYTGWKLLNIPAVKRLAERGWAEVTTWAVTVIMIVATDLLTGVVAGFAVALFRLLYAFARLDIEKKLDGKRIDLYLRGAATFMSLPKLAEALEDIPNDHDVHVHLDNVAYVDHACIELIEDWHERHPGLVYLETDRLHKQNDTEQLYKEAGSQWPPPGDGPTTKRLEVAAKNRDDSTPT